MSRRFAVLDKQENVDGTLTYGLDYLSGQEETKVVMVPKGINRFAVQGPGTNYVHGGAMLQEIVVPVITVKKERRSTLENTVSSVDVKLTTPMRKITNAVTYLEFFQTEKIGEKKIPRELAIYFTDEVGIRISNENRVIADSTSTQAVTRTFKEKFVFQSVHDDSNRTYYLIMEDTATGTEYDKYLFMMDIV